MSYFEKMELFCTTKAEKKIIKKLLKKFSPKSWDNLYDLYFLLYSLYLNDKKEAIELSSKIIFDIDFIGKFDIWTPVTYCLSLFYYVSDNDSDKNNIQYRILMPSRFEKLEFPGEGAGYKAHILSKNMLNLSMDALDEAVRDGDNSEIINAKINVLADLLLINAVNNKENPLLNIEINKKIDTLLNELRV